VTPENPSVSAQELLTHREVTGHFELVAGARGVGRHIANPRVQKSGLAYAGWLAGTDPARVQVLGETESAYLASLDPATRRKNLEAFFGLRPALVVATRGERPHEDVLAAADATDSPVAVSTMRSSVSIHGIHTALDELLAARASVHGVLVEIHGVGTLLLGPSSIGKSECALVLVERGHRLVADDAVELSRIPRGDVVGRPAALLRHHLEIRGLGILNVRDLYGATAVRESARIDLVVELERWDEGTAYDRLGLDEEFHELLGKPVSRLRMPVQPGRDMGTLLEVAARNHWLKLSGHHSARAFARKLADGLGLDLNDEKPDEHG
jgi:HPr kinase/phosphorylase